MENAGSLTLEQARALVIESARSVAVHSRRDPDGHMRWHLGEALRHNRYCVEQLELAEYAECNARVPSGPTVMLTELPPAIPLNGFNEP